MSKKHDKLTLFLLIFLSLFSNLSLAVDDIIIDDQQATFSSGWYSLNYNDEQYGEGIYYASSGLSFKKAKWEVTVPTSGYWEFFTRAPSHNVLSNRAPFHVNHSFGSDTTKIDQTSDGGLWKSLGIHFMSDEETHSVALDNWVGLLKYVVADAIKLSYIDYYIQDIDDAQANFLGHWASLQWNNTQFNNSIHFAYSGYGQNSAIWSFSLPFSGQYQLFTRSPSVTFLSTAASFTIKHLAGETTVLIDQTQDGGVWKPLGEYTFNANETYQVSLVNDNNWSYIVADAIRIVHTGATNQAPIALATAFAGHDGLIEVGDRVSLDGSGSSDPEGDALTYQWTLDSIPTGSQAHLSAGNSENSSFITDVTGDYQASLRVNDGQLESPPSVVSITATTPIPPNHLPIANAGVDISLITGDTALLDGSGSSDEDGDILSYLWTAILFPSGSQAALSNGSSINAELLLDLPGIYEVQLTVNDGQANSEPDIKVITVSDPPNQAPEADSKTITSPQNQDVAITLTGRDPEGQTLNFIITEEPSLGLLSGTPPNMIYTPNNDFAGDVQFQYKANDGELDSEVATVTLTIEENETLPNDPSTQAPPIDLINPQPMLETVEFLYTGDDPIQTGVTQGAIEPERIVVIRGKVLNRDGTPLPGIVITLKDHPEFGQTLTRADGMFDMAANGGGTLTLNYTKTGYLPTDRKVKTPWVNYVWADDVVLLPLDPQSTRVTMGSNEAQRVIGSETNDSRGTRQATIFFPPETTAQMILPDGTTQPLSTLTVRTTEYTVGENGPQAMPAPLPATSAYTYAVELSVDEAIEAGAKNVTFNQPVAVYVDNFLNFPVGGIVPIGIYDKDLGAWIPSDNGKIISIVSITEGMVDVDIDGNGSANSLEELAVIGITDSERNELTAYPVGKSLWRFQLNHFSTIDGNWPYGFPGNAIVPYLEPTKDLPSDCASGSVIDCIGQTLAEVIPVKDSEFSLIYQSKLDEKILELLLTQESIPASLKQIKLEIIAGGKKHTRTFSPSTNLKYTFKWDGKDVYGRELLATDVCLL